MIKLDIVPGFLGVGKTTLIKRYLKALSCRKEKVILIENDFGEIGIDKDILKIGDLDIYEINRGCLCCSLKGTFIDTLLLIAEQVKPDRVILEPSGIFILSEIFELFRYYQISDAYEIGGVVTVIDGPHFRDHQVRFGNFLTNQIDNAAHLMLSKTSEMKENELLEVVEELSDTFHGKEIIAKDWRDISDEELLQIFIGDGTIQGKVLTGKALKEKKQERSHQGFSSYSFYGGSPLSPEELKQKLLLLNSKNFGEIIRAKGFVKEKENNRFLEFHYVDGSIEILPNQNNDLKAGSCFIGKDLQKDALAEFFQ